MAYKAAERNLKNVAHASVRSVIDQKYNDAHDTLSKAYYEHWRNGESFPITIGGSSFDARPTKEESKALFDKLHGLIFELHEVELYNEAKKNPTHEKLNKVIESMETLGEGETETPIQKKTARIAALKSEGIDLKLK